MGSAVRGLVRALSREGEFFPAEAIASDQGHDMMGTSARGHQHGSGPTKQQADYLLDAPHRVIRDVAASHIQVVTRAVLQTRVLSSKFTPPLASLPALRLSPCRGR